MNTGLIAGEWSAVATDDAPFTIYPDGCRDVIYRAVPGHAPQWYISPLDDVPRSALATEGTIYFGYRIKAGAGLQSRNLLALLDGFEPDIGRVSEAVTATSIVDKLAHDALSLLRLERLTLRDVAAQMHVSSRTVQRRILRQTGRTPHYWLRLARIRESINQLNASTNFAELAAECGFCDQAHMCREYTHWLGKSPTAFKNSDAAQRLQKEGGF